MRKCIDKTRDNKGLTLIELMVSMAILAFGVVAGMMILVEAQKSNNFALAKTMAINESEQQMEAIFRDAPSTVMNYNNVTFAVGDLVRPGGGPAGLITVSAAQPRLVTVSVLWQGQGTLTPGNVTLRSLRDEVTR